MTALVPSSSENLWVPHSPSAYGGHGKGMTDSHYLCLFSAILRISQVLANLSDNSRVKPHSCSSDQARSGPMALANSSATFSTLIGEGPSLKFPVGDFWGADLVLLFCTRCRRSFHSSVVSGIQPTHTHRNTEMWLWPLLALCLHTGGSQNNLWKCLIPKHTSVKEHNLITKHKVVFWTFVEIVHDREKPQN